MVTWFHGNQTSQLWIIQYDLQFQSKGNHDDGKNEIQCKNNDRWETHPNSSSTSFGNSTSSCYHIIELTWHLCQKNMYIFAIYRAKAITRSTTLEKKHDQHFPCTDWTNLFNTVLSRRILQTGNKSSFHFIFSKYCA